MLDNKCLVQCPDTHGEKGGICTPCESPCKTCGTLPTVCLSCDGTLDRIFRFGPDCIEQCPEGTTQDTENGVCLGCKTGCAECSIENPQVCQRCDGLLLLDGECLSNCPFGYTPNFLNTACLEVANLDAKLVYFPFSIWMLFLLALSFVGRVIKKKHQVLANFIVMNSLTEHAGIVV